jgi:hypothetical protein
MKSVGEPSLDYHFTEEGIYIRTQKYMYQVEAAKVRAFNA